jgi:tetratricopeptide (TPR) repeat protein
LGSNPALLVKCLGNQGLILRLRGQFDAALDRYRQALQVVVDRDTECALRLHLGDMLVALEDPQGALEVYEDLLKEMTPTVASSSSNLSSSRQQQEEGQAFGMQGVLVHHIATIYVNQGDYDLALEIFVVPSTSSNLHRVASTTRKWPKR